MEGVDELLEGEDDIIHSTIFHSLDPLEYRQLLRDMKSTLTSMQLDAKRAAHFLAQKLTPALFDPEIVATDRGARILEMANLVLEFGKIDDLPDEERQCYLQKVDSDYLKVVENLRSQAKNTEWTKLWIFLLNSTNTLLHLVQNRSLFNGFLKILQNAFSGDSSQRHAAYTCWKPLIDNFAIDSGFLCRKVNLLKTPLCKLAKDPVLLETRFNLFVYLLHKLGQESILCLQDFLNLTFGPFDYFYSSDESRKDIRLSSLVITSTSTKILINSLGHSHSDIGCIEESPGGPIVKPSNFPVHCTVVINSVAKCCVNLNHWHENNGVIMKCLWTSVLKLFRQSDEPIQDKCCQLFVNILRDLKQGITEGPVQIILINLLACLVTISDKMTTDLVEIVFKTSLELLRVGEFDNDSSEALAQFIRDQWPSRMGVAVDFFGNFDTKVWANFDLFASIWTLIKTEEPLKLLLWPICFVHQSAKPEDVKSQWLVFFNAACQTDVAKLELLQMMESQFKENPLVCSNTVFFMDAVSQCTLENSSSKDFDLKFATLLETLLNYPKVTEESLQKIAQLINKSVKKCNESSDRETLDTLCSCIQKIVTVHNKRHRILPKLKDSIQSLINQSSGDSTRVRELEEALNLCTKSNKTDSSNGNNRSSKILDMAGSPGNSKLNSSISPKCPDQALKLFGKNVVETQSPQVSVRGSLLSSGPSRRTQRMLNPLKTHNTTTPSINDDNTADYAVIESADYKYDKSNLTEHQKEVLHRKREDIPALYEDLSQSQSNSNQNSQDRKRKLSKDDESVSNKKPRTSYTAPENAAVRKSTRQKLRLEKEKFVGAICNKTLNDDYIKKMVEEMKEKVKEEMTKRIEALDEKQGEITDTSTKTHQKPLRKSSNEENTHQKSISPNEENSQQVEAAVKKINPIVKRKKKRNPYSKRRRSSSGQHKLRNIEKDQSKPVAKSPVMKEGNFDPRELRRSGRLTPVTVLSEMSETPREDNLERSPEMLQEEMSRSELRKSGRITPIRLESMSKSDVRSPFKDPPDAEKVKSPSKKELPVQGEDNPGQSVEVPQPEDSSSPTEKVVAKIQQSGDEYKKIKKRVKTPKANPGQSVEMPQESVATSEVKVAIAKDTSKRIKIKLRPWSPKKTVGKNKSSKANGTKEHVKESSSVGGSSTSVDNSRKKKTEITGKDDKVRQRRKSLKLARIPETPKKTNSEEIIVILGDSETPQHTIPEKSANLEQDQNDVAIVPSSPRKRSLKLPTKPVVAKTPDKKIITGTTPLEKTNSDEIIVISGSSETEQQKLDVTGVRSRKSSLSRSPIKTPPETSTNLEQDVESSQNTNQVEASPAIVPSSPRRRSLKLGSTPEKTIATGTAPEGPEQTNSDEIIVISGNSETEHHVTGVRSRKSSLLRSPVKVTPEKSAVKASSLSKREFGTSPAILPSSPVRRSLKFDMKSDARTPDKHIGTVSPEKGTTKTVDDKNSEKFDTEQHDLDTTYTRSRKSSLSMPEKGKSVLSQIFLKMGSIDKPIEGTILKLDKPTDRSVVGSDSLITMAGSIEADPIDTSFTHKNDSDNNNSPNKKKTELSPVDPNKLNSATVVESQDVIDSSQSPPANQESDHNYSTQLLIGPGRSGAKKKSTNHKRSTNVSSDLFGDEQKSPKKKRLRQTTLLTLTKKPQEEQLIKQLDQAIIECCVTLSDISASQSETLTLVASPKVTVETLPISQDDISSPKVEDTRRLRSPTKNCLSPKRLTRSSPQLLTEVTDLTISPEKKSKAPLIVEDVNPTPSTLTCESESVEAQPPTIQLQLPRDPTKLNDSVDTTLNLSPPRNRGGSQNSDLATSPVMPDTPDRRVELLQSTCDLSPIKTTPKKAVPLGSVAGFTMRGSKLVQMVNGGVTFSCGGTDGGGNRPRSQRLRMRMPKEPKVDVLTFSREIPSPFSTPSGSILKRKFPSDDTDSPSGGLPSAKRKRVNFSDPAISEKRIFLKDDYDLAAPVVDDGDKVASKDVADIPEDVIKHLDNFVDTANDLGVSCDDMTNLCLGVLDREGMLPIIKAFCDSKFKDRSNLNVDDLSEFAKNLEPTKLGQIFHELLTRIEPRFFEELSPDEKTTLTDKLVSYILENSDFRTLFMGKMELLVANVTKEDLYDLASKIHPKINEQQRIELFCKDSDCVQISDCFKHYVGKVTEEEGRDKLIVDLIKTISNLHSSDSVKRFVDLSLQTTGETRDESLKQLFKLSSSSLPINKESVTVHMDMFTKCFNNFKEKQ